MTITPSIRSRGRRRFFRLVLSCVVVTALVIGWPVSWDTVKAQTGGTASPQDSPVISGMRAHLFKSKTADWSADVLAPGFDGGWNTVAGPNAANATLVIVEVSGARGGTYTGYFGPATKFSVRLVAQEPRRQTPVLDRTQAIPVLNEQGKGYVPFLIYQSGCAPVRLTATVVGRQTSQPLERTLPFACGE
jgi:hypothetical protein